MAKKRSKLDIIRDILGILRSNKKTKITHLIYKANLSNNIIKGYIEELSKNGMMNEIIENKKKFYVITKKGLEFIEEYNKMKIFTDAYGLEH